MRIVFHYFVILLLMYIIFIYTNHWMLMNVYYSGCLAIVHIPFFLQIGGCDVFQIYVLGDE